MTALRPYPAYKPSGVDWIGDIPAHWVMSRARYQFREIDSRAPDDSLTRLSMSQQYGLVPTTQVESWRMQSESAVGAKIAMAGDLVLNRLKAHLAVFATAPVTGTVSPDYTVLRPASSIDVSFFESLFRTPTYRSQFFMRTKGIVEGFWRLYTDAFYDIPTACPPLDEQRAIAAFLDAMDARITRFIDARRRMIALLEEQKQAIINQAVTKGLDPDVPMKPSGIEWLGDIPAHWEVAAVARNWKVTDCKHVTVPFVEPGADTYPLASVVQSQWFDLNLNDAKHTTRQWYEFLIEGGRRPKRGDLVFCRNVSVGVAANVTTDLEFALGQDVCLLSTPSQSSRFLNYYFRSGYFAIELERALVGSTFRRINVSQIRALIHPLPPAAEQCQIASFLDDATTKVEQTISRSEREIELIQEYRTRLISDVVTGKLDVRGAMA